MTRLAEQKKLVGHWNRHYEIGTSVRYWPGIRDGEAKFGVTRSAAELFGGHTAVVWIEGHSGCVALTHVEVTR